MHKNEYKDKYFSVLGDSISTLSGYNPPDYAVFYEGENRLRADVYLPSDTWWGQVIAHLGGKLLVNNSFSGSTVCDHRCFQIPSYGCSDERTSALGAAGISPDVIMIYIGTNDWGHGFPIDEGLDSLYSFHGAYSAMLKKIRRNYPEAEIWCFTLSVSRHREHPDWQFPYYYGRRHIEQYCDAIRSCAKAFGCRLIDLYENGQPYESFDGFHPTAEGMKNLSDGVMEQLSKE